MRPDMIVLGTHQRTGLDRLRRGSVAERVALQATQPVLIVPARTAVPAEPSFESMVVAVDFSSASDRAVELALTLSSRANGRVTLLHVVPGAPSIGVQRRLYRYGVTEYRSLLTRDAWRRLQDSVPSAASAAAPVHARVVAGEPPAEIARIATEVNAGLIVVGVTRRNALARKVFGTTTARVMRAAGRPILAVPEPNAPAARPSDADRQSRAA
jgi:nucleotide-binding universal stress UspA family protein